MYNPDYPTTSYGWNAFTYHTPYDQQTSMYYNGQGVANPFAATASNVPTGSRRQIGQEFAQNWNNGYNPIQVGFASSPYAPAYQQPAQPYQYPYGNNNQQQAQNNGIAQPPKFDQPSLLSPNAFQQQSAFGTSPAPTFDCLYNGQGSVWDKSSKTPAWNNIYTQERKILPPSIDWKAQDNQQQQNPGYGYGYNPTNMNPNAGAPQFAQPTDDWLANAKANFAL